MKPEHKFFERHLDNNLEELSDFLHKKEKEIRDGKFANITQEDLAMANDTDCFATALSHKYNIFQFNHPAIYNLFKAVRDMVKEGCEYYGIDFEKQNYMLQGWFNLDGKSEKSLNDLHDHCGGTGVPYFHGYYCVNAEPSITHYNVNREKLFDNININNRAIISETGHPHRKGEWHFDTDRITIAYDVMLLKDLDIDAIDQHWVPLQ